MAPPRVIPGQSKFDDDAEFWVSIRETDAGSQLLNLSPRELLRQDTIMDMKELVSKRHSIAVMSGKEGHPGSSARRQFCICAHPSAMNVTLLCEEPSAVNPYFRIHCKISIKVVQYLWKRGALEFDLFRPSRYFGEEGSPQWRLHRVLLKPEEALSNYVAGYYEQRINRDPTAAVKTFEIKYGYKQHLIRVWWPNRHQTFMELRYLTAPALESKVLTDPGPLIPVLRNMLVNDVTDSPNPEAQWSVSKLSARIA